MDFNEQKQADVNEQSLLVEASFKINNLKRVACQFLEGWSLREICVLKDKKVLFVD